MLDRKRTPSDGAGVKPGCKDSKGLGGNGVGQERIKCLPGGFVGSCQHQEMQQCSVGSQEFDVTKHARQATVRNTHICCVRNKYAYLIQPSFNLILELANWRPRKVNSPRIQQVVNGGAWILT